eukprot:6191369-Pleurochrysis_carterae.AAC.1
MHLTIKSSSAFVPTATDKYRTCLARNQRWGYAPTQVNGSRGRVIGFVPKMLADLQVRCGSLQRGCVDEHAAAGTVFSLSLSLCCSRCGGRCARLSAQDVELAPEEEGVSSKPETGWGRRAGCRLYPIVKFE